eukprot:scaffold49404_cov56-Attheya_sp.AAC.1
MMVLGDTPTTSADSSDDEEAGGDEESVDSFTSNLSALGTLVDPSLVHHVEIRKEYCRAIVSGADTGEIPFICCRGPQCRTAGHAAARKSKSTAPAGYYIALVLDDGRVLDALEQQQNESVTFEDAVYNTPIEASTLVEDDETEQRKPQGRPSTAPDSKVASGSVDTQALDVMLAMSEQIRQMNVTNQALTKMLMVTHQPGATAPPAGVAPTMPTPAKKSSLHQRGYHAVALGKVPGIYEDKDEVQKQVQGFPFATWKSFKTYEGAHNYMLAFELANHIRDQKDLFAKQELDWTLPSSILRGQKTSSPSTGGGASFAELSRPAPSVPKTIWRLTALNLRHLRRTGRTRPRKSTMQWQLGGNQASTSPGASVILKLTGSVEICTRGSPPSRRPRRPTTSTSRTLLGILICLGGDQGADTAKKNQGWAWGHDPSTRQESKFFNIAVRSEGLLIDSMTPDNISPQARQALTDVAVDAVAQPGASRISDNNDQTNTLTLSVATLVNGMGSGSGRLRNVTDYLWKQERRTTMRYGIDTLEKLKTRIGDLEDVGEWVINHLNMVTRDILVQEGWSEEDATDWATSSLVFRISSDTIRNYIKWRA